MVDVKRSDKWMGRLGILQSLIVLFCAYSLIGVAIDMQDDFLGDAENRICPPWYACTAEEKEELRDLVDFVQHEVVIWQVAWSSVFLLGVYFFYVSFRLVTGPDHWVPLRGVLSSKVPALKLGDRQLFIFTVLAITFVLFLVGYLEFLGLRAMIDKVNGMELADGEEIEQVNNPFGANGSVLGFCNTAFLFLILIIAFFSRDKPGAEESDTAENMLNLEEDSSDIGNDDSLELAITSEEKTDEE